LTAGARWREDRAHAARDEAGTDQCRADTDRDGEIGVEDLLNLNVLAQYSTARYACDGSGTIPQRMDDGIQKVGYGDPVALEACIEMVTGGS
jgi:hypothetical protein